MAGPGRRYLSDADTEREVTLVRGGGRTEVVSVGPGETILQVDDGGAIDLEYDCRAGRCSTCTARLLGEDVEFVGGVDFESASEKAAAITPVPGGVGPMTVMFQNVVCVVRSPLTRS